MSINCDQCNEYVHDKEQFKFIFKTSQGNLDYDVSLSLCYGCFDDMFSVNRFARLCGKNNQLPTTKHDFCCLCDDRVNVKKEIFHIVRCFDNKVALEILYCDDCYKEDVGV